MKLSYSLSLSRWFSFLSCVFSKTYFQEGEQKIKTWRKVWKKGTKSKREHFTRRWMATCGWLSHGHAKVLIVLKGDDDTQSTGVPANTNPAPNQTVPHNPLLQAGSGEKGGWRGVDESLNRMEEGHTGAMAIPKTTYLLSHNDSACQNNCQDT